MAARHGAAIRNAKVAGYESAVGVSPKVQIRTGARPTNLTDAAAGTLLVEFTLPSDWLTAPSNGVAGKNGTWPSQAAVANGVAGHYRLLSNDGSVVHEDGTVTGTGGGGDMTIDNTNIAINQIVAINSWGVTAGNAT